MGDAWKVGGGMREITTLGTLLRERAAAHPDRIAIVAGNERISYAEVDRRATRVANGLIAAGIKPGARIALLDKNDPNYFELQFGCAKAGAVLVPINTRLAPPEIAYIVKDSGAEMLCYGPDFAPAIAAIESELGNLPRMKLALPAAMATRRGANANPATSRPPPARRTMSSCSSIPAAPRAGPKARNSPRSVCWSASRPFSAWAS
jgi:acyl-CoA synthetase (AMP-forming)/AMP-acid ligase II